MVSLSREEKQIRPKVEGGKIDFFFKTFRSKFRLVPSLGILYTFQKIFSYPSSTV